MYPAFPPFGDNVRDIDMYGELSHFAPVRGDGVAYLAVRNWGPITVHFTVNTAVHSKPSMTLIHHLLLTALCVVETPVTFPISGTQINVAPNQYQFFTTTRSQSGTNPTLSLSIQRAGKKRSAEQTGSFVVLVSNDGEFPAISDFTAGSDTVYGQRFDATSDLISFEATSQSTTVVFAIYNEGSEPLQASLTASLQTPGTLSS